MGSVEVFTDFDKVLIDSALALLPFVAVFLIFQVFFIRLSAQRLLGIGIGILFSYIGLSLFLQGVHIGFIEMGNEMGEALGNMSYRWVLIPIGFLFGFTATFAEPAIRILNYEVEKASSGYIPKNVLLMTLSLGVAVSVALSMTRIIYGLSLIYFIAPGYLTAIILSFFSKDTFTSIAFDSGGVATGPMTVTFVLALTIGITGAIEGRDPLQEGFGMIALVALAPILSVLILGLAYKRRDRLDDGEVLENEQQ